MTLKKYLFLLIAMTIAWNPATAQQAAPAPAAPSSAGSQQQPDNANGDSKESKDSHRPRADR